MIVKVNFNLGYKIKQPLILYEECLTMLADLRELDNKVEANSETEGGAKSSFSRLVNNFFVTKTDG